MSLPKVMRRWSEKVRKSGDESDAPTPVQTARHMMTSPMSNKNLYESFYHAFEGLSHVLWTQKHVRIQLMIVMLVLLLSYILQLQPMQVLFVFSAIALVLMAELFNTAVEVVVNMVTESYHPLAKIAKDVAAAGVLISSIYALLVGFTVFVPVSTLHDWLAHTPQIQSKPDIVIMVILAIAIVFMLVPLAKIRVGHGTILRGGAVSGHSAVAFLLSTAIIINSNYNPLSSFLALVIAILVAQSRVEGKIHTVAEVIWGAIVAVSLMALLMLLRSMGLFAGR